MSPSVEAAPILEDGFAALEPKAFRSQMLAGYYAALQDAIATWDPTAEITSPDFVDRADLGTIAAYVNAYETAGGGWGDHVAFHPYAGAYNETTQTSLAGNRGTRPSWCASAGR